MTTSALKRGPTPVRLALAAAGMVVGGGLGWAIGRLVKHGGLDLSGAGWSDLAAGTIAAMLLATGLMVGLASFNARIAGRMMDPASDRPARPAQTVFYRQQGVVMALAGVMLAAPVAARLLWAPLPAALAQAVMAGIVALFLLQTLLNLTVWMRADEMMRRMIAESGSVCFWVLQGALFLWAAAEKLDLAPALSAWDLMTILMGVYLVVSSVLSVRRGFS
ncbi:MAG: hypothetical protein K9G59_16855 [Caulobacter sp.]|nr:hypothetical protein [Caulobacter sp.]